MSQIIKGNLPITIWKKEQENAIDYRVYGTAAGAGVQTENLWDEDYENISTSLTYKSINVGNGSFTLSTNTPLGNGGSSLLLMPGQQSSGASTAMYGAYDGSPQTVTSVNGYVTLVYRIYDHKDPRDYQTMLTKGSTAPVSYLPYGYKLPMTITSGQNTDTYQIYIGGSKLGEEEYVDYGEQKVYKRTENLFDKEKVDPNNNGYFNASGEHTWIPPGQWTISDFISVEQGSYIATGLSSGGKNTYCCVYNSNKAFVRSELLVANTPLLFNISEGESFVRLSIRLLSNEINSAMFTKGSTSPETYIPYLNPTDPPASLPTITAYKGENTLSSTETVGNVSLEFNEATFYAGNSITQVYTNNQLYDLIDSSFYSLIANPYDSTQTYETDSYCIYNYCLYKCITAITVPEAFNPAKWQQLNLSTYVRGDN